MVGLARVRIFFWEHFGMTCEQAHWVIKVALRKSNRDSARKKKGLVSLFLSFFPFVQQAPTKRERALLVGADARAAVRDTQRGT